MKSAENRKQPIFMSNIQDFGVTKLRGVERESRREKWRRPVALYGPLAAGRSLDNRRQILCPSKPKSMTSSHAFQVEKTFNKDTGNAPETSYPQDMRLASLRSMRPTDLEKQSTAQQHLLPDCAHTVTVINSRTRGPGPMMMGNLNEEASNHDASDEFVESEDGELYRAEIRNGKTIFIKPRHDSIKGNTKGGGVVDAETHVNGTRNRHLGKRRWKV